MVESGDIRAGGAFVEIGGRLTQLDAALKLAETKIGKFGAKAAMAGKAFVTLGAAMAAPLGIGIKMAADFQDQLAMVATMLSGPDLQRLPKFSSDLRQMSVEFGEGTQTLSKGLFDVLSASVPAAQAMDVLGVSVKAARAGFTDTGTAADAITTIINSYGLAATEAGSVADLFFAINKRGKTTFAELAPAIGLVASTASASGLSMEELGASLATMTRNGVPTQIAVTSLNSILSAFLKPTEEAKKAAREFGFELNTNTLKTEGLVGVLAKLNEATPEQVAAIFQNVRALRGLNPMIGDQAGFMRDVAEMTGRAGQTQEAFSKASTTLGFRLRQMGQAIKQLFVEVGLAIADDVQMGLGSVLEFVQGSIEWIKVNRGLIKSFGKMAISILTVGAALFAIGKTISLIGFLGSPAGAIGLAIVGVLALADALGIADTGFGEVLSDIKIFGRSIGNAVQIAKLQFQKLWVFAETGFDGFVLAIKTGFPGAWAAIKNGWAKLMQGMSLLGHKMAGEVADILDGIVGAWNDAAPEIARINANVGSGLSKSLAESMASWRKIQKESTADSKKIWEDFERDRIMLANSTNTKIAGLNAAINKLTAQDSDNLTDKQKSNMDELTENMKKNLDDLKNALPKQEFDQFFTDEKFKEWFASYQDSLTEFQSLNDEIWGAFASGVGDAVSSAIVDGQNFLESLKNMGKDILKTIISTLVKLGIQELIHGLLTAKIAKGTAGAVVSAKGAEVFAGQFAAMSAAPFPINLTAPAVAAGMLASYSAASAGLLAGASFLAKGGIVTGPTLAVIGEAGPEAVIPLDGGMLGSQTIVVELDGETLTRAVVRGMPDVLRLDTGGQF